jgi:hypothetical protein
MGPINNPAEFPGETDSPYPPRYRWLKRSALIGVLAGIAAIVIYLGWGTIAAHRLQAEIDRIHARGDPILLSDFPPGPPIADADNAAWYYKQASAALQKPVAINEFNIDWDRSPSSKELVSIQTAVQRETPALRWARQARLHPIADWKFQIASPANWTVTPYLRNSRLVAMLEVARAMNSYAHGDGGDAIEAIRDEYHIAYSLDQLRSPSGAPHLVAILISRIAFSGIQALARDLNLSEDTATTQSANMPSTATSQPNTARRKQIVDLISEISDTSQFDAANQRMAIDERVVMLDGIRSPSQGFGNVPSPMLDTALVPILETDGQLASASAQRNYTRAMALIPQRRDMWADGPIYGLAHLTPVQRMAELSITTFFRLPFQNLAERRAAVIAMAIRLYRFDHADEWPRQLSDLVPAYLPAVPLDPFSPTDAPFQYKPNAPGGPIIYSVGENGIDDGGSETQFNSGTFAPWDKLDAVFHLTRPQTPATVPTTAP